MNLHVLTGNKGFIGTELTKFLQNKNNEIIGVSRNPNEQEIDYFNLNTKFINDAYSLIHLAGKAHDLKKISDDKEYFKVNTELTKTLFDQFMDSDCEVFIYMSSVKAVADNVDGILTEDVVPHPTTAYGKSKLQAERYIQSKEIPVNKRVYILRPCMVHGPNNKGNLNLLYRFVSKDFPYPLGKYENRRSFVSLKNLCFIVNELIHNSKIKSGIYNISDDTPLSTIELVKLISEEIGKPARILKVPKLFIQFISKVGDFLPLPINSEKLSKLTENYVVSNSKIKTAVQKEFPLTSKEGIKKTLISFLK